MAPGQKAEIAGALKLTTNPAVSGDTLSATFWNQANIGPTISGARFQVQTNGSSPRLDIDSNGNVGIGTTSPKDGLHVFAGSSGQTFANNAGLIIESSGSANNWYALQVASAGGGKSFNVMNAGNVGIGTTSPATTLEVAGNVTISGGGTIKQEAWITPTFTNSWLDYGTSGDTAYGPTAYYLGQMAWCAFVASFVRVLSMVALSLYRQDTVLRSTD